MNYRYVPLIEKPCPMKWDDMQGDEKRRFCEQCQLHVHNLSAMTPKEQGDLLAPGAGWRCITYLARPGAQPVDAATWQKLQSRSWLRRVATAMLMALTSIFVSNCRTTGKIAPQIKDQTCPSKKGDRVLGEAPTLGRFTPMGE